MTQAILFEERSNFFLIPKDWGNTDPANLLEVLKSCRNRFFENLDNNKLPQKTITVRKSPYEYPVTFKQIGGDEILLSCQDRFWVQYSYQFAHELCHHVINAPSSYDDHKARFGWLEESLCELASLCVLYNMSVQWSTHPPYPNWANYSNSFLEYANNIINAPENNVGNFRKWLCNNLDSLYSNRYDRALNRIIALKLFPAFNNHPKMWILIQYLAGINYDEHTSFEEYLKMWESSIPTLLQPEMTIFYESIG